MPNALRVFLQTVRARQVGERKLVGRLYSDAEHICQWPNGIVFEPNYVSHRFAKLPKKSGLPLFRFHELRHTIKRMQKPLAAGRRPSRRTSTPCVDEG